MISSVNIRADIAQAVFEGLSNRNNLFIGTDVMPVYSSDVKSGVYLKLNLGNSEALNDDTLKIAAGSGYPRTSRRFDSDTFDAIEYGLEEVLPDANRRDLDRFFDTEVNIAAMLLRQIQISHEARVAYIATFDVPADVANAKLELAKYGVLPNTLVMSQPVFERIRRSVKVQNQFFGVVPSDQTRLLSEGEVAAAVGVDRVLVGRAAKNTAKKGQPYAGGFIWGNTYMALCDTVGGDFAGGGFGRTIVWAKDSPVPFVSETYRDDARRADVLRVRQNSAEKVIDGSSIIRITTGYV